MPKPRAQHSVSCYLLNGEHLQSDLDKENLLAVIMGMERFLLDTNSLGSLAEAKRPENHNKAFVLGETVADEVENLEALLFGRNVDNSNNNLFCFGFVGRDASGLPEPYLIIDRLDSHHRLIFNKQGLRDESRERAKRTDIEFLDRERERMAKVSGLKRCILEMLQLSDVASLPPSQFTERKKSQLVQVLRSEAPTSFNNYYNGVRVACLCYAALLLEQDEIGEKTRKEFTDPTRRNLFGDTRIIQNALWLKASILSNDRAVKRMVEYLSLPEISVN